MWHMEKCIQWQHTRPPSVSKMSPPFSGFRILQSITLCCYNAVNWELKSQSESTDYSIVANYQSPQLKLEIRSMIWLVLVLDQRWLWKYQDFHHCKELGKLTAYGIVRPLCNVSQPRRNSVVGENSKSISEALRDESTVRRIVHFLRSTTYANSHGIACLKVAKTAKLFEKDTTGRRGVICMK